MSASYPPVGTRVRWTSQGGGKRSTKEGVVRELLRGVAFECAGKCAFRFAEAFGTRARFGRPDTVLVVEVVEVDGSQRKGSRRWYRPRPQWLEVLAPAEPPGGEAKP